MKMNIVGVDPSMRNFGIVLAVLDLDTLQFDIKSMHLTKTKNETSKDVRKSSDDYRRAKEIMDEVERLTADAALAFVEMPIGSQDAQAMKGYGMSIMAVAAIKCPVVQVSPREAKLAATGCATATKEEMIEWATAKKPDAPWLKTKRKGVMVPINDNEHLADACAAIEAGLLTQQFKSALALFRASSKSPVS